MLQIYQGESSVASENIELGQLMVNVPKAPAGQESVEVRFTYDTSGLLTVDAKVISTGKTYTNVIENLAEAMSPGEKVRRLREMDLLKISPSDQAENVALVESLKHLYEILLGADRARVVELLDAFDVALDSQDERLIKTERERLVPIVRAIESDYVR
ncbi:MAG: hypothetical protein COB97_00555 [Paracoccus sp.]|nr:MAG: hypothetical protein COB97_00555 [Paracoccus sp. (in: a-proteobacteria)]